VTDAPPNALTPGASAITEPALPTDAAAATAMRNQLTSDSEYMKDWRTNGEKSTMLGYLRWVAAGNDPARWGKPAEDMADVQAKAGDRGNQFLDLHRLTIDQHFDLNPAEHHEVVYQRPFSQQDKDAAAREYAKVTRDAAFMEKWRNGDRVSRSQVYRLNVIKAAPLARSDAEIDAWQAAHPFNQT